MALQHLQPQPFLGDFRFAEGPRWHGGWLWFSEIEGDRVMRARPGGSAEIVTELSSPSGLGFLPDGSLLVVAMPDRKLYRLQDNGKLQVHADLSEHGSILNDMVVGRDGRAYVDAYRPGPAVEAPAAPDGLCYPVAGDIDRHYLNGLGTSPSLNGSIIAVEMDGSHKVVAANLNYPNGLAIMPDGRTLIASISHVSKLLAFDIGADGTLANPRIWADMPGRHPDGICVDSDGGIWVACLAISAFQRVLEGGFITHNIATPGLWAVAPALGGDDRRTLFLVSMEPMEKPDHRSSITCVQVTAPGAGWP